MSKIFSSIRICPVLRMRWAVAPLLGVLVLKKSNSRLTLPITLVLPNHVPIYWYNVCYRQFSFNVALNNVLQC